MEISIWLSVQWCFDSANVIHLCVFPREAWTEMQQSVCVCVFLSQDSVGIIHCCCMVHTEMDFGRIWKTSIKRDVSL